VRENPVFYFFRELLFIVSLVYGKCRLVCDANLFLTLSTNLVVYFCFSHIKSHNFTSTHFYKYRIQLF
jgi:hypothetical protein